MVNWQESATNVARVWGLAEDRIRVADEGIEIDFGSFQVSLIRSEQTLTP